MEKIFPNGKPTIKLTGNIMEIGDELKLMPGLYKDKFEFLEKTGINKFRFILCRIPITDYPFGLKSKIGP